MPVIAPIAAATLKENDDYGICKVNRSAAFDAEHVVEQQVAGHRVVEDTALGLSYVAAIRTPSAKKKMQKRQGARYAKRIEITADEHDTLSPEAATSYRARTARANYLSQDRIDISDASKELCKYLFCAFYSFLEPTKETCQRFETSAETGFQIPLADANW